MYSGSTDSGANYRPSAAARLGSYMTHDSHGTDIAIDGYVIMIKRRSD